MKFTGSELISHQDKLISYAVKRTRNRDDALELVQTTFMKAIRSNETWKGENLGGWLMSILKNALKDYYEKLDHSPQLDDSPIEEIEEYKAPQHLDAYRFGKIFNDDRLDSAFNSLSDLQKEIIYYTYLLDMDDADVSKDLGVIKRTLISRRKKAMDKLKREMTA